MSFVPLFNPPLFGNRRPAPKKYSPRRWDQYSRFICKKADHFNDEPYFAAPEPAWAFGGEPLDTESLTKARKFFERELRRTRKATRKILRDAERVALEREKSAQYKRRKRAERRTLLFGAAFNDATQARGAG